MTENSLHFPSLKLENFGSDSLDPDLGKNILDLTVNDGGIRFKFTAPSCVTS